MTSIAITTRVSAYGKTDTGFYFAPLQRGGAHSFSKQSSTFVDLCLLEFFYFMLQFLPPSIFQSVDGAKITVPYRD